tara:strand:- start:1673 stop:2605 length:933 start_codon:yes stop_codon:yes gene_type:complete
MKVLIIGLGNIGFTYDLKKKKMHLTHSNAFFFNKNFNLIGGIDKNKKKLNLFKKKYKVFGFLKIKDALKNLDPDIFVISTNTSTHLKIIKEIFSNKVQNKILLCEKPCGNSLKEIEQIKKICKKNNSKIFVNYMRSSMHGVNELIEFCKKDNNYFTGITYYNKSILNEASHYINLFQKVFGKIIKVKNEFYKSSNKKINNFTLFFKNGNIKFISLNNTTYHNSRFEIFLKSGYINYNSDHDFLKFFNTTNNKIYDNIILNQKSAKKIKLNFKNTQMQIVNQLINKNNPKTPGLVSIDEAINTMKIIKKLK